MLKNYIKIAWRNIKRNKIFSFINVVGLTSGLTCFLLIALYIVDETTFDGFHHKADQIYRVVEQRTNPERKVAKLGSTAYQISVRAKADFPEIGKAVRLVVLGRVNVGTTENSSVFYEEFWLSNADFLETFDFKLLEGNRATALSTPNSVIITEETALKLFNTTAVLGKTIKVNQDSTPYQISGVQE